jgi:hypothetical protein
MYSHFNPASGKLQRPSKQFGTFPKGLFQAIVLPQRRAIEQGGDSLLPAGGLIKKTKG